MKTSFKQVIIKTVVLILLTSCETAKNITTPIKDFIVKPIVLPCPDYRVLADASKIEKYKPGPGRSIIDIDFYTKITGMHLTCTSKINNKTGVGLMDVDVNFDFSLRRGAANTSGKKSFQYFISVTDLNYKIIYRETFSINLNFKANKSSISFSSKPITIEIPITENYSSQDFIVFGGFEISREQLKRNRIQKN
mgnify:CR=1 FL=1